MSNVIAVVWDFDKTLIDGYMEDSLFEDFNIDSRVFWEEVNALPEKYKTEQGIRVNSETIYLNHMIKYVREGRLNNLSNSKLKEYGSRLPFYKGVPEIFKNTKELISNNKDYQMYDIKLEHYIVSTGLTEIIKGSPVQKYVDGIWGCEFIETENEKGEMVISEVGYTIDNTTKTRALFEINKGVGKQPDVEVNTKLPEDLRRVKFINMIYVADGPSDIPAFSVVNQYGGATFAIYPHGNMKALKQVETMRENGRIHMFAEADYSEGSTAYMWLTNKITEFADRIIKDSKERLAQYTQKGVPQHLI